ncbi:MAG: GDSL-type esterase/lipase family protein [Nanoarchaeota archaeon]
MDNILGIWGDSITWGAWDRKLGGWAARLGLKLNNATYEVYNLGVSGDTTVGVLDRFPVEAYIRNPTQILIAIGVNDLRRDRTGKQHTSPAFFVQNLNQIFSLAKKYTKKVAAVEIAHLDDTITQPVPWNKDASYSNAEAAHFNALLRNVAKKHGVKTIPVIITDNDLDDGIHPNEKGHEKIAKTILAFLKKNKWTK